MAFEATKKNGVNFILSSVCWRTESSVRHGGSKGRRYILACCNDSEGRARRDTSVLY